MAAPFARATAQETALAATEPVSNLSRLSRLADSTVDIEARRALAAEMLALPPDPALFTPLLELSAKVDEPLLPDVAALLGHYREPQYVARLIQTARTDQTVPSQRLCAIGALGHQFSIYAAGTLVDLLDPPAPPSVRAAALAALAELAGIDRFDGDPFRWKQWWAVNRILAPLEWQQLLLENHAARSRRLGRDNRRLAGKVLDVQRQLYRATPQAQRETLLRDMLADSSDSTRQLAVDLMVQRLIDQQPVGPELAKALLAALDDTAPAIRQGAARVLREIADPAGRDAAARRLVGGQEQSPEVLRIYLLMMADDPRAVAVDRAMELLMEPNLRDEAAGVLVRAAEQRLLSDTQRQKLKLALRRQVEEWGKPPAPNVVELLGYVGDDEDWKRIEGWLDGEQTPVKEAAARAWRRSDKSVEALIQRSNDPVIQPLAIAAATERGTRASSMLAMLKYRPKQEQVAEAWDRAMEAMAGRASPQDVLRVDDVMGRDNDLLALRERMMTAALGHFDASAATTAPPIDSEMQAVLTELRLRRAEVRLKRGDAKTALADLTAITTRKWSMSEQQAGRQRAMSMAARLATGDIDGSFEVARADLEQARTLGSPAQTASASAIATLFLDAADRNLTANQPEQARTIVSRLTPLLGALLDEASRRRIGELEVRAREANKPPAPLVPFPSAGAATQPTTAPAR